VAKNGNELCAVKLCSVLTENRPHGSCGLFRASIFGELWEGGFNHWLVSGCRLFQK